MKRKKPIWQGDEKKTQPKKGKKRIVSKDKKLQKAYEEIMDEYSEVFEKLAKN